jgi:hypothetical protein
MRGPEGAGQAEVALTIRRAPAAAAPAEARIPRVPKSVTALAGKLLAEAFKDGPVHFQCNLISLQQCVKSIVLALLNADDACV